MSLDNTNYVPEPHTAFVHLYVNDSLMTLDKDGGPFALQSFSYTRALNGVNSFSMTLATTEWNVLWEYIARFRDKCAFQFGRYGEAHQFGAAPDLPGFFDAMIQKVTPSFGAGIQTLVLEGFSTGFEPAIARRSQAFPTAERFEENLISDIVHRLLQKYAVKLGYKLVIDETMPVLDYDSFTTSTLVNKRFNQNRMSDMEFIKQVLAPRAVSKNHKVGGYLFYRDDMKKEYHFHPPNKDPISKVFIFGYDDKNSEVINFTINDMAAQLFAPIGAEGVKMPFWDIYQKVFDYCEANDSTTPKKPMTGKFARSNYTQNFGADTLASKEYSAMFTTMPQNTRGQAEHIANDRYMRAWNLGVSGELVVVGQYLDLVENSLIKILVIGPNGETNYVSGCYRIQSITDEIAGGVWTSRLNVYSNGNDTVEAGPEFTGEHVDGK